MKEIIINRDNLKDSDMTEIVKRVKILLINSNNEILLGYSHNEYQFPGGHVENSENLIDTVKREILEETGIDLNESIPEPFACNFGYYKDWPEEGKNRKIEIYYYEIKTDEKPNLEKTKYTDSEKNGNFELKYVNLDNAEEELQSNVNKYGDPHSIAKEMIDLFKVYKELKKDDNLLVD